MSLAQEALFALEMFPCETGVILLIEPQPGAFKVPACFDEGVGVGHLRCGFSGDVEFNDGHIGIECVGHQADTRCLARNLRIPHA